MMSSCSKDDVKDTSKLTGSWKLTSYSIGVALDINKDGETNLNLLKEINCETNEILKFENTGVMSATDTFQHEIEISSMTTSRNIYTIEVKCAEGAIGFATTYTQIDENKVVFNTIEAIIDGNQLTRTIAGGFNIYNEDLSEVIETKTITLAYTKQ